VRYLLDTVTFLFASQSLSLISTRAARLLEDEESTRCLSAISISEIAIKHGIGKLDFGWRQVLDGVSDLEIEILPYTEAHAQRLFGLPMHHKDPFDRQIVAQALAEAIAVVTPAKLFRLYEDVDVIW
jgi:PIN domain nuclease of toxin-antitoxin system